jgi:hypothetical protein
MQRKPNHKKDAENVSARTDTVLTGHYAVLNEITLDTNFANIYSGKVCMSAVLQQVWEQGPLLFGRYKVLLQNAARPDTF